MYLVRIQFPTPAYTIFESSDGKINTKFSLLVVAILNGIW